MNRYYASFVDAKSAEIIQRVSLVMPLADELLSQGIISREAYSIIFAEKPSQNQMRMLYKFLSRGGDSVKSAFYHVLKKHEKYLVDELESGFTNEDMSHETQHSYSDTLDGGDGENMEVETLKQQWHKISQRWEKQLKDLLKDSALQSVGNGKLFLCTNEKYKIGDGCEGTKVYIGIKADGTEVAIKRMIKSDNEELKNEKSILRDPKLASCYIVKYVDFVEEGEFNYLALQLCEYDLDNYMECLRQKGEEVKTKALRKVAKDVLLGLQVLHNANVLHRDIKPGNVLLDVEGNARLADFGLSRRLNSGASTKYTSKAGTPGWEAAEILADENENDGKCRYKKSTDIQVAGMLVHYILSDGFHPFGRSALVLANIVMGKYSLHQNVLQDVEAKDLIEGMIQREPNQRLTIEEALSHPYFWNDKRRDMFLRKAGDEKAVQKFREADENLCRAVAKYTEGRSFSGWQSQMPKDPRMASIDKNLPDNLLGLLRYLRNSLVHNKQFFYEKNMFKDLFPDFFISALKLTKEMGWEA
ncbi:serine/threonine-protein kinase/endoribonuclease ire-1-like [Salminus brasiliensis]|uniref:serine/threonine-protein kinase/endoribonuclease ire-1-like n=1 Tax=Salminus brasiliensis TaxID=930266 RepID=UPI003B82E54D